MLTHGGAEDVKPVCQAARTLKLVRGDVTEGRLFLHH